MAAISNVLGTFLKPGDRVVSIKDSYGGTNKIFNDFLPPLNIDVCLCETTDYAQIEVEIAKGCQLLYLETPTNPTIKIIDIKRLAAAAHKVGALVVVDNTFATPINQNPLQLGADIVLHSASKYLGGHADALGGVICGSPRTGQAGLPLSGNQWRHAVADGCLQLYPGYEDLKAAGWNARMKMPWRLRVGCNNTQ